MTKREHKSESCSNQVTAQPLSVCCKKCLQKATEIRMDKTIIENMESILLYGRAYNNIWYRGMQNGEANKTKI